jgi:hypothetical protein
MARFNHLLREYENLRAVASIFSVFAARTAEHWLNIRQLEDQLAEQRRAIEADELETARRGLGLIEASLQSARQALEEFDNRLFAYPLRALFQQRGARREEVAALLKFLLARAPHQTGDHDKLDYLATRFYALSCGLDHGVEGAFENAVRQEFQRMLDDAGIAPTNQPDPGVRERFQFLREEFESLWTFEQLSTQDTLGRLRDFKARLKDAWFQADTLIEVARTNLIAGRRFQQLANHERQQVDRLAAQLLSAGISQVEHPESGALPVEDAREMTSVSAHLLDQDYRRNRGRLLRIAQLKSLLEQAHSSISQPGLTVSAADLDTALLPEPVAEIERILDELRPTPERLQEDLRARVAQISMWLNQSSSTVADAILPLDGATITLAPWERAAFQADSAQDQSGAARLHRLLRVSVALMAELQEKVEWIRRGVMVERLQQAYLAGARYLAHLSQQTARELENRCLNNNDAAQHELCEQLHYTRRKLLDSYSDFSAKIRDSSV